MKFNFKLELFWWLLGELSLVMAALLVVPIAGGLWWGESEFSFFIAPAIFSMALGFLLCYLGRQHKRGLTLREGVLFMVLVWFFLAFIGMLPYAACGMDMVAAFFEAMSALTTTGLTAMSFSRAELSRSLMLWHSLLTWLGGLGFMVMVVTIIPQVSGCFGVTLQARQLMFFSPVWNKMLTSIKQGVALYFLGTSLAVGLFFLAGVSPFTALILALTTVATGGSVMGAFLWQDNLALEMAGALVMLLSGCNLLLAYKAWSRRTFSLWLKDTELRIFILLVLAAGLAVSLNLFLSDTYTFKDSLRYGFFQAISFSTTNGYASAPFWEWQDFSKCILLLLSLAGGCMGSAAGGFKIIRLIVIARMSLAELKRTLHPRMVLSIRLDGVPVPPKIMSRILAFFFLYAGVLIIFSSILALAGISPLAAIGLAAGCLTSTGGTAAMFGIGSLAGFPAWAQLVAAFLMVLGRVEIFSFLVLAQMIIKRNRQWI